MVLLKERIRRLEDGSTKVPQSGINLDRAALIRGMICIGRRREDLTRSELELYDDYVPLEKPLFDSTVRELISKIRSSPATERSPSEASLPALEPDVDDEPPGYDNH